MKYLVRRLLLFVVALFAISVVIFLALRVLPGDIATIMAGLNSPPERVEALRAFTAFSARSSPSIPTAKPQLPPALQNLHASFAGEGATLPSSISRVPCLATSDE